MIAVVVLVVASVVGLVWRTRHMRAMTALTMLRRRLGPDGVVIGGEGFVLDRPGAPAVLLLHGGGDTPQTLRYLANELHAHGFHVSAPLLPGHGRGLADFARVTADALADAARASYSDLRAAHGWVAVIGVSMGGALAVQIAAAAPDMPALGLVAPYLALPARIDRAARIARLWGILIPAVRSGDGISVLDPVERERSLAYGVFTAGALRALRATVSRAAAVLPRVMAPTLVIQSREDNRISVADAERAFSLIGAREKRLEWVTGAAHIITVDYGRERVIASLTSWMERYRVSR
jgi:carboxylesterase